MRTLLITGSAIACFMLGACGTTGITSGYSNNPADWSMVSQHPRINEGIIPPDAFAEYQYLATDCNQQVEHYAAGPLQSAGTGGLVYGAAGVAGGSGGAQAGFGKVVSSADYGVYTGVQMFASGAVNGLQTGSYGMATLKGGCTSAHWSVSQKMNGNWAGTFVHTVTAGRKPGAQPLRLTKKPAAPPPSPSQSR